MSLIKYNRELRLQQMERPTVKGTFGRSEPNPDAEELRNWALRHRSGVRANRAGGVSGLGFDWGSLIDQGFDLTKTVLKTRPGSFETTQDMKDGQLITNVSGRQPSQYGLPIGAQSLQFQGGANISPPAGIGAGAVILGGGALLLVLMMKRK